VFKKQSALNVCPGNPTPGNDFVISVTIPSSALAAMMQSACASALELATDEPNPNMLSPFAVQTNGLPLKP
jgi:hypothetical protein|tara:strand:+ start:375 stop:587 length:213 start_codon:yes stop_codon:yes gene_type:complete